MPSKKNVVADALSCYLKPKGFKLLDNLESNVEDFINSLIATAEALSNAPNTRGANRILKMEYSQESKDIAVFLRTLKILASINRKQARA